MRLFATSFVARARLRKRGDELRLTRPGRGVSQHLLTTMASGTVVVPSAVFEALDTRAEVQAVPATP
jgi:hypothetical protein